MKRLFNEEEKQFILKNSTNNNVEELITLFNKQFHRNVTYNQMRAYKLHNKIKMKSNELFNQKEKQFILKNIKGLYIKEFVKKFNNQFHRNITYNQIRDYMKHHKLKNNLQGFKKGIKPHNYKEIGTEVTRIRKSNQKEETFIKVEKNKWMEKHRYMYQTFNGNIPKNNVVIFLDGNKKNYDKLNLKLISKQEELVMAGSKLFFNNKQLTKIGLLIAKLKLKMKEVE